MTKGSYDRTILLTIASCLIEPKEVNVTISKKKESRQKKITLTKDSHRWKNCKWKRFSDF